MVATDAGNDIVDMILRLSGYSTMHGVGLATVVATAVGVGALLLGRGRNDGVGVAAEPIVQAPDLPLPGRRRRHARHAGRHHVPPVRQRRPAAADRLRLRAPDADPECPVVWATHSAFTFAD